MHPAPRHGLSKAERLPPELWSMICASACLDTGVTGRSLSLVSRYIHDVSRPYKYQSVSVPNAYELTAFESLIEKTPENFRQVKRLFVCDIPQSGRQRREADPDADEPLKVREAKANAAVVRIFRAVAPTLVVAHALFVFSHPFCLLPPLTYPALVDLTLYHHYRTRPAESDLAKAKNGGLFPALERLSLVSAPQLHKSDFLWIGRLAPNLTYLHVTAAHPLYDVGYSDFPVTMGKVLSGENILPKSMVQVMIELPDLEDKPLSLIMRTYINQLQALAEIHKNTYLLAAQASIDTNLDAENRWLASAEKDL